MAEVVSFPGDTVADWPVDVALEKAKNWGMERCVIVGTDPDGNLRFGGSTSDIAYMNFVLDMAKADLIGAQLEKSRR